MLAFALGLFLSCFAVVWAPGLSLSWVAAFLLLVILVARTLAAPGLFLLGVLLGCLISAHRIAVALEESNAVLPDSDLLTGTVEGMVARHGEVLRFDFLPEQSASGTVPTRLRVSWRDPAIEPLAGERWRLPLVYGQADPFPLPGQFDSARWQFRQGIGATARVNDRLTAVRLSPGGHGLGAYRTALSRQLDDMLGGSASAALIRGVTVGDRSGFSDRQWDVLNGTGTTHLVAISGLHIGLVGGLVFALLRLPARQLPGRLPARLLAGLAALASATAYAALAGFALPTRRALTMFGCLILLLFLRRRTRVSSGLAMAAALVLLLDPLAVMDAGFYLSFVLVALVMTVVAAGDRPGALMAFGRVQWVTGLAVLPLLLLFFAYGPLASPLANALAVPVFSALVVPFSLLGAALVTLGWPGPAAIMLSLAEWILDRLWPVLEWLHAGPALSGNEGVGIAALLLGLLATLALVLPGPVRVRAVFLLALLPAVVGSQRLSEPQLEYWGLDAGGHLWRIRQGEQQLIWLDADASALGRGPRAWLHRQAEQGDTLLVMNVGEGLGPGRLDPLLRSYPTGQVFLSDAGRASSGSARFCGAGGVGAFELSRQGRGREARCRVSWAFRDYEMRLDRHALSWRQGQNGERRCLPASQWGDQGRAVIKTGGRLVLAAPRPFWWRPQDVRISAPVPNTVSCSGITGP